MKFEDRTTQCIQAIYPYFLQDWLTQKTIPASRTTKLNMSKYELTPTVSAAPTAIPRQRAAPKIFVVIFLFLLELIKYR